MLQYISFTHQYLPTLLLIMIKLKKCIAFTFARNRIRRQIQFDPKLKDFTSNFSIGVQEKYMRSQFQKIPTQKLSNALTDPNPKLGKRFYIPKQSLNKEIRKSYKQKVSMDSLQSHDEDDLDYIAASKSHLNDQQAEIQFERKFKQQLFRAKETQKMVSKKQKQINNYLPNATKDEKYLNYVEGKKSLKNKKIKNMMDLNRNNEQLQLLIQSGFASNPANIKNLIGQLAKQKQSLLPHFPNSKQENQGKELIAKQEAATQLQALQDIGPEQLKDRNKIQQFVHKYCQQHTKDQQECLEDLNLLKAIREYEQQLFLSRYEGINFRFKGKVNFGFFHQNQLVSYVKNEQMQPKDLLLMFRQNKNELSKFKVPIITPPVLSAIYSKTSLYQFPQSQTNNRLNMLNDPKFRELERTAFKEIHKFNDADFCSVVAAYAFNHQDEQGILAKKRSDKINDVIYDELSFRIFNLNDKDLGLVLRAISKLPVTKSQKNWHQVISYLDKRLPLVSEPYAIQSVFQFLLCLPFHKQITDVIVKNISLYSTFKWEETSTVLSFCHVAGLVLGQQKNIQNFTQIKAQIKDIIVASQNQLHDVIQRVSINNMSHFLIVFTQSQASLELPKLGNRCKKLVIQNIKGQKEIIKQKSLVNVLNNFVLLDTQKYLESKKSKFSVIAQNQSGSSLLRKLCIKALTVLQPIPFNSSQYLIYHELATFTHSQIHNLSHSALSRIIQELALVKYKNESLSDEICRKIIENIEGLQNQASSLIINTENANQRVKQLLGVVNCFGLQKRQTNLFKQAFQHLMSPKYFTILVKQPPSVILRFLSSVLGLQAKENLDKKQRLQLQKILTNQLLPLTSNEQLLNEQQIACVAFCGIMLGNYAQIESKLSQLDYNKFATPTCKFIIKFCYLISRMGKGQSIQQKQINQLSALQSMFYSEVQSEIQYNASCIGQPLTYKQVYSQIANIYGRQAKQKGALVKHKNWVIELPQSKEACFVASYDHLQTTENTEKKLALKLTGAWKLYSKYYQLLGWNLKIVVSFLEGK